MVIISPVNRSFQEHQKLNQTMTYSERTFISGKILWGTKEYNFSSWYWIQQSVLVKAVPQSESKACTYILKISEFQIEQEKSHTHTHTKWWCTVRYLVSIFLNYKVEQMRSHWTPGHPGSLHQFPQSVWEVFFQGFLCTPKQWVYSMRLK
jgi:hypothetical protein